MTHFLFIMIILTHRLKGAWLSSYRLDHDISLNGERVQFSGAALSMEFLPTRFRVTGWVLLDSIGAEPGHMTKGFKHVHRTIILDNSEAGIHLDSTQAPLG